MTITFKALHESDFPLLLKWLKAPHVKKWWDQDVIYTMGLVKEKFGKHIHGIAFSKNLSHKTYAYIICVHEEMVGYIIECVITKILAPYGGYLWDGFRSDAPADWKEAEFTTNFKG